jgi:septum formation protein
MAKNLYLASASPRRKELLELTDLEFQLIQPGDIDEEAILRNHSGDVLDQAEFLAREKGRIALEQGVSGIFITADTLVIADDGTVLGKPADELEAGMFLDRLAGNWHTVATGVALSENIEGATPRIESVLETTRVKFAPMTDEEISAYIATGEPYDKAGGYGIQGRASIHIERIDGCYFNVVGFPLHAFWKLWKKFTSAKIPC